MTPLRIACQLTSLVALQPPHLDSLLIVATLGHQQQKLRRDSRCPEFGDVEIPIDIKALGDVPTYSASSPICVASSDRHEFRQKYIDVAQFADLVAEKYRKTITPTDKGWMKREYKPIRVRRFDSLVWFAIGNRDKVRQLLSEIPSIGGDRARGYGRVDSWSVTDESDDWSRFVSTDRGTVLMRPLPVQSRETVIDMIGATDSFGACQPPYYHPDRQVEIVVPT